MVPTATSGLLAIGGIIFVDLVLSGDNALVIGAAASTIPARQRLMALVLGGIGAIVVRIVFTSFATFILNNLYLQAIGGVLVLLIAIRLLFDGSNEPDNKETVEGNTAGVEALPSLAKRFSERMSRLLRGRMAADRLNLLIAILTIVVADITMSLDNILAIGALAAGNILFLSIGLILSIVLLMIGSALVAMLMTRFPWLIIGASLILAAVAADLLWHGTNQLLPQYNTALDWYHIILFVISFTFTLVFIIVSRFETIKNFFKRPPHPPFFKRIIVLL